MSKFISNSFQMPNAVVDEFLDKISGGAFKCYALIARQTTGWQKQSDRISTSQFMAKCNIKDKRTAYGYIGELEEVGLIKAFRKLGEITEFSLNFDFENDSTEPVAKNATSSKNSTEPVAKNATSTSSKKCHSTKDNIKNNITNTNLTVSNAHAKKTKIKKINPEELDELIFEDEKLQAHGVSFIDRAKWSAYCEMRKAKGKSAEIKTKGTLEAVLKKLLNLSGGNYELATAILEQSIGNTWTGLFALKAPIQHPTNPHSANDPFADNGTWGIGRKLRVNPNLIPEELR